MRAATLFGAALALTACADVAGPTRTAPSALPGTLTVIRTPVLVREYNFNYSESYVASYPLADGDPGIWRLKATGEFTPLFLNAGGAIPSAVALSPDGGRIAWLEAGARLVTLDFASGERRLLTPARQPDEWRGAADNVASWSPDGSQLATIRVQYPELPQRAGRITLVTTSADGATTRRLLDFDWQSVIGFSKPSWHPNGQSLLVAQRLLVPDPEAPQWSPFRTKVIARLLHVSLDGPVQVLWEEGAPDNPTWAPDGQRFAATVSGGIGIFAPDGTQRWKVPAAVVPGSLAWAPDGSHLAFCASEPITGTFNSRQIVRVHHFNSRVTRTLSPSGVNDCWPSWSR